MKKHVIAVRDKAAECFGQPMFVQSKGIGMRAFADEVNRKETGNQLFAHPEDFDLFYLGTFDDVAGTFDNGNGPAKMTSGLEVKTQG